MVYSCSLLFLPSIYGFYAKLCYQRFVDSCPITFIGDLWPSCSTYSTPPVTVSPLVPVKRPCNATTYKCYSILDNHALTTLWQHFVLYMGVIVRCLQIFYDTVYLSPTEQNSEHLTNVHINDRPECQSNGQNFNKMSAL